MFLRASGESWAKDSQKKAMRRACALAEIKRFGFHQLRHSAASRWITLGVSLKVVAEQLGHVDTKMVERYYGHFASGHIAQTFRALPRSRVGQGSEGQKGDCGTDADEAQRLAQRTHNRF